MILEKTIKIEVAEKDAPNLMSFEGAQEYAKNLGGGWRVPTKEELDLMYGNRDKIKGLNLTGSFPAGWYWSGTPDIGVSGAVAKAMRESGRTCDEDSWDTVMAWEAVRVLRDMGALK